MENSILENKYYKILELDKIMEEILNNCDIDKSKDILLSTKAYEDMETISLKLNETNEALILITRFSKFPIYFSTDVSYILSRIHKNALINPMELALIGNFIDTLRDLFNYFNNLEDKKIQVNFLNKHLDNIIYPKELNLEIHRIVTPYGEIKDDASANLKQIRKNYESLEKSIASKLQEILQKNASKLSQAIVSIRDDRYVIPVKSDFKNQIKGIIHDESASGETVYIEPMVICEMNNKMASLKEEEKREIDKILREVSLKIDGYYNDLSLSYDELIDLDITFAKAKYSKKFNGTMPSINKDGVLELYNCYHPLLNVDNIIKNNIFLGKDYKGIIITGPNTGGKTVLLKTIGLLSLMIKFAILIPADEKSNIMIFDDIYADIGDEQSINQNLSTFSSHMTNVINIINNVNEQSLVLLDELGSGTDPVEGSSLAIAIFDYLIKKKCLLVATSHYSELKIHAYNSDTIINASVEFDINTLKPTYRLLIGVPGMSNAIHVASNLGLREDILKEANEYVYKKNDNLNIVLDKMVKQSNLLDKKIKEVELEKEELNNKIKLQDEEINKTIQERSKIIASANIEKDKIIQKTKDEIDDLIYELKELKKNSKNINIKEHEIADLKHKSRELYNSSLEDDDIYNQNIELKEGMKVYIKSYNTYGTIIKVLNNNRCEVSSGIISMKIDNEDLKAVLNGETNTKSFSKEKNNNKAVMPTNLNKQISIKLDLRGKRYDEAKDMIEKYLDDCVYANFSSCTIIHGFGTGTMRKLVQDILKKHPNVKDFRYGGEKEGGFGATIVNFKE